MENVRRLFHRQEVCIGVRVTHMAERSPKDRPDGTHSCDSDP